MNIRRFATVISATLCMAVLLLSCSDKKEKNEAKLETAGGETAAKTDSLPALTPELYKDWGVYRYHAIQIRYSPNHHLLSTFPQVADWYEKHIPNFCEFLGIPPYTDTLRIYFYSGYGQGTALTGREDAFVTKEAIHYWLPTAPSSALMRFLLQQWKAGDPHNKFLIDGFAVLFDYSGLNYFAVTRNFQKSDSALTLRQLANDTTVNSFTERYQSVYAATFVNFFSYTFGIDNLRKLYQSNEDFEAALRTTVGLSLDSVNTMWQQFIVESYPDAADTKTP